MPSGIPFTPEFKVQVVETVIKEELTFTKAAKRFHIYDKKAIGRWYRLYKNKGKSALLAQKNKKKGIKPGTKYNNTKPPKKPDDLDKNERKELEYLRAENAYLKKLEALTQKQGQQG